MDEAEADEHWSEQRTLSVSSSTQTWPSTPEQPPCRIDQPDQDSPICGDEMQPSPPSPCFEELFCFGHTSITLFPLCGTLMTSARPRSDLVRKGYLGKQERNHRRYFVLRSGSHTGPSRLEWYKSREKFAVTESAGRAALFGSNKQGVIYLRCCLGVSRMGSAKAGHTVVLYTKDQTLALAVEDEWEQDEWYLSIRRLMEEEVKMEERGKVFEEEEEEEDDGYCTLPPAAYFKEVWPVTVKPRGLGCSSSLSGDSQLCLTVSSLILVRLSASSYLVPVDIPLLSVRRFGHSDGSFFLELGRSAPHGPGEIWMEVRDQGNTTVAQRIHEKVREAIRELRALPDFSSSPTSSTQNLWTLKNCRPKYRDKPANPKPLVPGLSLPPRNPENSSTPFPLGFNSPVTPPRCGLSSGSYVEMKVIKPTFRRGDCWEPGGEEEVEEEYMMMSPQGRHSLPVCLHDGYFPVTSPQKHEGSAGPSYQTSMDSATSGCSSPPSPSLHQTSNQPSQTDTGQSEASVSCTVRQRNNQRRVLEKIRTQLFTVRRNLDGSGMKPPPVTSGPDWTSTTSGSGRSGKLQAAPEGPVRRTRLSLFLPVCLRAKDRS